MRRRTILAAGGMAIALGTAAGYAAYRVTETRRRSARALLDLALPDLAGKEQQLAQWRGKVLVVNFWATWCAPCREEMPHFVRAQAERGASGLQFVGIAIDQPDKTRQFVHDLGINYPVLVGGYGAIELSRRIGNTIGALPFTVVIDRKGDIALTQLGAVREPRFDELLQKLLRAA